MLPIESLLSLAISAVVPKILEWLKSHRWALFIQPYAPMLNRFTAASVACLTALGVTVDFNAAAGVLTIAGLHGDQLLRTGITAVLNFAVQEIVYRNLINQPKVPPGE